MNAQNSQLRLEPKPLTLTQTLRVAIVGCGRIARAHAEAVGADDGARLSMVCDTDPHAAQRLATEFEARAFASLPEMLGAARHGAGLDVAIVATPPSSHAEAVLCCLREGVHVLCEKPLGIEPRQVEVMIDASHKSGRALMMASKFRFVPRVQELREQIAGGELGELILYRGAFVSRVEMAGRMNAVRSLSGGGVLMDNGPHLLDLARFLAGPLSDVRARSWPRSQVLEVEDGVTLEFRLASHASARGEGALSWSGISASDAFVEVCGTHAAGSVRWDDYSRQQAFAAQWRHFAEVARGVAQPLVSHNDALENACAIAAAYASL